MPVSSRSSRFQFSTRNREAVWQHLGAFGLTGLLLMLAFPRPGWGLWAYVALVPAAVAAGRTRNWRRLWWAGWLVWGLWWAWMLRWLTGVSPAAPAVLGLWLGLNTALGLVAAGVLNQKLRWPMAVALPLGWISVEALRSVWPVGGLSWFTLAHSQAMWDAGDVGRVVQTADLLGPHTAGLVVAVVNGALADVLLRRKPPRASVGLAVLFFVGALGYGQWRISGWQGATQDGPRVAVVQTARRLDNQSPPTPQENAEHWKALVKLHGRAAEPENDAAPALVVWPETIVPAPLNPAGVQRMRQIASVARYEGESEAEAAERLAYYGLKAQFGDVVPAVVGAGRAATIVGANGLEFDGDEIRETNAAFLVSPDGTVQSPHYAKQHRVPMGEYLPGPGFLKSLIVRFTPWPGVYELTPGDGPVVMTAPGGWQVATPICYEDAVAGICRDMVYGPEGKRLDLLVNLTNDGWYSGKGMRRQHAQLASLRCIENRVPMARSVNTGISGFIDSLGRTSARLDEYEPGVLTHRLRVDGRATLYGAIGGWPWVLFVLFTAGATGFGALFGRPLAKHRIA